jgi:hypothetical protein
MATCFGYRRIGVNERRFDEKGIRVSGELHDLFNISVRKGAIDNIGDLASRGDFHDLLLKQAKGESGRLLELPITPCDIDESIIVRAAKRRLLERTPAWIVRFLETSAAGHTEIMTVLSSLH